MLPRPAVTSSGQLVRFSLILVLITASTASTWFVVNFDMTYTDGLPSGPPNAASIEAQYIVDDEIERATIHIDGYTAFSHWLRTRKSVESFNQEDIEIPDPDEKGDSENYRLDATREVFFALTFGLLLCELLLLAKRGMPVKAIRFFFWVATVLCMLVVVPISIAYDMADGGISGVEEPPSSQFTHVSGDMEWYYRGLEFDVELEWAGYDMGLIPGPNRSAVRDNEPVIGTPDHDSRIAFDGNLNINSAGALQYLLFIPIIWFLFPTKKELGVSKKELEVSKKELEVNH
jgi:hypothetical protein